MTLLPCGVFVTASLPLLAAIWWTATGALGPEPIETLTHHTGLWGLRLLLLTLAMTPLRRVAGQAWPLKIRRQLGLWSFTYLSLHFLIYLVFDLSGDPGQLAEDLLKRTWITAGFAGWALLVPLAATSTRGWQRRLGRRWKSLHKLVYLAALSGSLHFIWQSKIEEPEPYLYFGLLLVLLAFRIRLPRRKRAQPPPS